MRICGRALTQLVIATLLVGAQASFMPLAAAQKDQKDKPKLDKAQTAEIQALVKLTDAVAAGQPLPAELPLTFQAAFLKAQEGRTYVPFVVSFDASKFASRSATLYLRVVQKAGTAPAADTAKKDDKKDKKAASPDYAFEDAYFVDLKPAPAGQLTHVGRAFAVVAGDYDVYVAVKERTSGKEAPKVVMTKLPVTVPDYWANELTTSTIILAEKIDPANPAAKDAPEGVYSIGSLQITPASEPKFAKKDELNLLFQIYNTALDAAKKPDIVLDYAFYQKTDAAEKFFNRTNPQTFNASTLPPQFDTALGHQLVAGQSIPLASFAPGDYRLEIKITDKVSTKTLTRNVTFTVVP
jgi:hypothetical protein